jgi:Fe-S-cluster containining protein
MVAFHCDRCGKCCVSLGPLITIERQLNDRDYYCRCKLANSVFLVHVDPEYCEDIADEYASEDAISSSNEKKSCRFLRKNPRYAGFHCAIYSTRPSVCRDFRCYRMLIYNMDSQECGRVVGRSTLKSADEILNQIWKEHIVPLPHNDDILWEKSVVDTLAAHGYRGETVR